MQKQARKWPVSVSISNLNEDVKARFAQCSNGNLARIVALNTHEYGIDAELVEEYGIDACRIAVFSAQKKEKPQMLLESAYKWLARQYSSIEQSQGHFSAAVWLEAFYQARDQVCLRDHLYSGLASVRRAARLSPLCQQMSVDETNLAGLCIYPFAPVFALHLLQPLRLIKNLQELTLNLPGLLPVRYRIEKGGWQWSVFCREDFEKEPMQSLLQRKMIRKACMNKEARLEKTDEGLVICLN